MTRVPGATATRGPAIVGVMSRAGTGHHRSLLPPETGLELAAEFLDAADDGRGAGVRQHADRLARHVLRQIEQQVESLRLPLPRENSLEDFRRPSRAFAALGALRARLVGVELRE